MTSFGNNITRDIERDLKGRNYPPIGLKKITDGLNTEEINEDLTKIIDKFKQIEWRFEVTEKAIINAIDKLETDTKENKKVAEELKNELKRLKQFR